MKKTAVLLFLCLAFAPFLWANVVINEFMASNDEYFQDPDETGEFPDWIELYNSSDQNINLSGHYLTDNPDQPTKWQIAQGTQIAAKGFLFFIADSDPEEGDRHTNFNLNSQGEFIGLVAADGATFIDSLTFVKQYADVSYGRSPDGANSWYYFDTPTHNARNSTDGHLGKIDKVQFSHQRGFYETPFSVSLSVNHPDANIYYTLDGSEPNNSAGGGTQLYTEPISITTTSHVRARAC